MRLPLALQARDVLGVRDLGRGHITLVLRPRVLARRLPALQRHAVLLLARQLLLHFPRVQGSHTLVLRPDARHFSSVRRLCGLHDAVVGGDAHGGAHDGVAHKRVGVHAQHVGRVLVQGGLVARQCLQLARVACLNVGQQPPPLATNLPQPRIVGGVQRGHHVGREDLALELLRVLGKQLQRGRLTEVVLHHERVVRLLVLHALVRPVQGQA
mmetsp:Transcript_31484/g.80338  ORF Transcript_31484/g.80338 Transcript_31484/m.80338 type:complete len:212 (+) Transcript_31484:63-698(+)